MADRELAGCELARSRPGLVAGCELAGSRARRLRAHQPADSWKAEITDFGEESLT
ncbi:UNVERIFIED_CONTAM: hypothetical protein Sradi_1533100 [Sesamum radiatum]|uniref:Uncharacterized protein n=1 Tax=Sesamum radiatum TaxID=300843 RepID=A0AAW2U8U7_SESRA